MKKKKGRLSIMEDEKLQEEYIGIYLSKFFFMLPDWELAKKYDCSKVRISKALKWVNDNFIKIPNKILLKGYIFQTEERIKRITEQLEKELKKRNPATRSVVEMNRELREDSRDLMKVQNLYKEKYEIELETGGSVKEILQILSKKGK